MEKKANQRSFWMPLVWAGSIVIRARKEDRVKNDQTVSALITQINDFRTKAGKLLHYDWVPVPLVYTQVIILILNYFYYSYFECPLETKVFILSSTCIFPFCTLNEMSSYNSIWI